MKSMQLGRREQVRIFSYIIDQGNDEADSTLNQMLVEMDGFGSDTNVVIFAATNRKDVLDDALTRPGRFDRNIQVTLPDIEARKMIFLVHLEKILCEDKPTLAKKLASLTPGFNGAEIRNVCNEAAINAARRDGEKVTYEDFEKAVERTLGGIETKSKNIDEIKKTVAIHECGHAILSWFLQYASPLMKLTIIPRSKGEFSFAQYHQKEDSLQTLEMLKDKMVFLLGGRIAEELFFDEVTNSAQNDFSEVFKVANNIVSNFGMGKRLYNQQFTTNRYGIKGFSDLTNEVIDSEIEELTIEAYDKARSLLIEHKDKIKR